MRIETLRRTLLAALAPAFLSAASIACAQTAPLDAVAQGIVKDKNTELVGKFDIDTSIPDSPGFAAIGLEPASVLDPGVEPITYVALTQFLDEEHNLKSGFAVGGTPYWWLNGGKKLTDYREKAKWFERVLARTSISAAFADGGDVKTDKLGFGFRTDLFDDGDYRLDTELYNCVGQAYMDEVGNALRPGGPAPGTPSYQDFDKQARDALAKNVPPIASPNPVQLQRKVDELIDAWREKVKAGLTLDAYKAKVKTCQADAAERYAVKPSLLFAAGVAVDLDNGDATDWEGNGGSVWLAWRNPISLAGFLSEGKDSVGNPTSPSFITTFGKYVFEQKETVGTVEVQSDAAVLGLVGGYETSKLKLAAQVGHRWVDYDKNTVGKVDDDFDVYSIGAAWKLRENLWLKIDAGETGERGAVTNEKNSYLKVSFAQDLG